MNETIEFDGKYRPEHWMHHTWHCVRYFRDGKKASREPLGYWSRGTFHVNEYDTEAEAKDVCDKLNKG